MTVKGHFDYVACDSPKKTLLVCRDVSIFFKAAQETKKYRPLRCECHGGIVADACETETSAHSRQESCAENPWKLLVAVTLLNKTAGKLAIPVFDKILSRWPTPWLLSQAPEDELVDLLRPLGTYNVRTKRLVDLSRAYLKDPPSIHDERTSRAHSPHVSPRKRRKYQPTAISHLPGTGAYALDSYRIFCLGMFLDEWKEVYPLDKELIKFLRWKWAVFEQKQWDPVAGIEGPIDIPYIEKMIRELEMSKIDKSITVSLGEEVPNPLARSVDE
ncbi:unnamed protein product [Mycena citricolor]|uniref:HhH-GPD domain-containing protein n=1 Tax=Mycena citricolor TaxID=2018698 RepID=A0AAD2HSM0_9AGAR|nr:unnamed protein product [Mycena citricolor]